MVGTASVKKAICWLWLSSFQPLSTTFAALLRESGNNDPFPECGGLEPVVKL